MCLGMNDDRLNPGERCASTSNRNFEGRQGAGGRSHLVAHLGEVAVAEPQVHVGVARSFGQVVVRGERLRQQRYRGWLRGHGHPALEVRWVEDPGVQPPRQVEVGRPVLNQLKGVPGTVFEAVDAGAVHH